MILLHVLYKNRKIMRVIIYIIIHSWFCVLNFMLKAYRPNVAEVSHTTSYALKYDMRNIQLNK